MILYIISCIREYHELKLDANEYKDYLLGIVFYKIVIM